MEITTKTVEMINLQASEGMVLCDGHTMTSIGGKVIAPAGTDVGEWSEMTQEAAAELIKKNTPEEEE